MRMLCGGAWCFGGNADRVTTGGAGGAWQTKATAASPLLSLFDGEHEMCFFLFCEVSKNIIVFRLYLLAFFPSAWLL